MIDYVVWCPGRCGSILTSRILLAALYEQKLELLHHTHKDTSYTGPAKIIHSHSPEFFINSKVACTKVALTRNIFDSAVSQAIMLKTKIGNLVGQEQLDEYKNKFSDYKFIVDPAMFTHQVKKIDNEFTTVLRSNAEYVAISYEQIKDNPFDVLKLLKINKKLINIKLLTEHVTSKKIPIEKSQMVTNFSELKQIYDNLNLKN